MPVKERIVYKNCEDHYSEIITGFKKNFKLNKILSGRAKDKKITISKCEDMLLLLVCPSFIKEFLCEKSLLDIEYFDEKQLVYQNSIKSLLEDRFLISKRLTGKNSYIFNIYSIKTSIEGIKKYCKKKS